MASSPAHVWEYADSLTFTGGHSYTVNWDHGPLKPELSQHVGYQFCFACAAGSNLTVILDPAVDSERTLWIDGEPIEVAPVRFSSDLSSVGGLRFAAEATRERNESRLLVRSRYRQPFGVFTGEPTPGVELAEGYGVMEEHDVWW